MNVIYTLAKTKFVWSANSFIKEEPARDGGTRKVTRVKVTITDPEGVSQSWECSLQMDLNIVLSNMIVKHWPDHEWKQERRQHYGHLHHVKLNSDQIEYIGEAMHTALRKCTDSQESSILWNAWHDMSNKDIKVLLDDCRKAIKELKPAEDGTVTRYQIGNALRTAWSESLEKLWHENQVKYARSTGFPTPEKRLQTLALKMMWMTVKKVTIEDWVWGVGYYLGTEVKEQEA